MILLALGVFGLIFGSFVNAFVWRMHEGRDWVRERSECPHCHHILAAKDLVPVFSWLSLGGKCRYCRKPIPDSPLVELLVPALFVLSYVYWPLALAGTGLIIFMCWLIFLIAFVALAVYDLRWYLLPDKVIFPLIGLAAVQVIVVGAVNGAWANVAYAGLAAALLSGLFLAIFAVSRGEWIGFGDVKLAIILGLLAGDPLRAVLVLFFASFIGLIVAVPILLVGKAGRKSKLPFGPLLIAGMILIQLFGTDIVNWYTSLLGA
jgi:leader peptidase (prepilin peptidase)/N-methyltransferase